MGETSDFGGSLGPTPCEASETAASIDEAQAAALGFDQVLAMLNRRFSESLQWGPGLGGRVSASGYAAMTTLEGTLERARIELLTPSRPGCEQRLRVTLNADIHTGDGAISIKGQVGGSVTRDTRAVLWGALPLAGATGTLRIDPSALGANVVGNLSLHLDLLSDSTRGILSIELVAPKSSPDGLSMYEVALTGAFPVDECNINARPRALTTPCRELAGLTPSQVVARLATFLGAQTAAKASWSDGSSTTVVVGIGAPHTICVGELGMGYRIPLSIRSADQRVNIQRTARAFVAVASDASITTAWFEVYDETALKEQDIASAAGISGVKLGSIPEAFWQTEVRVAGASGVPTIPSPGGNVVVTGIGAGGVILDPIATLTWTWPATLP